MEGSDFFDGYQDIGGGDYISSDEKDVMLENGIPFKVIDVVYQEEGKFGERYVIRIVKPDDEGEDEERLMSFSVGSVESRDRMLSAMQEWLSDADNAPPYVKLDKVGRAFLLVAAEAPKPEPEKPARRSRARS